GEPLPVRSRGRVSRQVRGVRAGGLGPGRRRLNRVERWLRTAQRRALDLGSAVVVPAGLIRTALDGRVAAGLPSDSRLRDSRLSHGWVAPRLGGARLGSGGWSGGWRSGRRGLGPRSGRDGLAARRF